MSSTKITGALRKLKRAIAGSFNNSPRPVSVEKTLAPLDDPFRSALLSMYRNEPQLSFEGQPVAMDWMTKINPPQGMELYKLCCDYKPKSSLEIGMAYGFSTIFLLAALTRNGSGNHTAIDPFQKSLWHGIGLQKVKEIKAEGLTHFIEDYSVRTATDMVRAGRKFEYIYIDGSHRFDDALVDFILYAQLCPLGGIIILDDVWMPSLQSVVSFIKTNRSDFVEVPSAVSRIVVFKRISEDNRAWDHFAKFKVASGIDSSRRA